MPQIRIDGRTARAERTRAAIVDAHLALIAEGDLRPTGERIAERAGVSLRALWTNFRDMETLFEAGGDRLLADYDAAHRPIPPAQPLEQRVAAFCRQRARLLQMIAPAARAAQMREPLSPQLRRNRAKHIERVRAEVESLFAAELADAGPGRDQIVHGIVASAMWPAWSMLREALGLSTEDARAVMVRTVAGLLAGPARRPAPTARTSTPHGELLRSPTDLLADRRG
jgi:TetR/AcrR family transcriptional regulator of autoinduction and epiphytic fitness